MRFRPLFSLNKSKTAHGARKEESSSQEETGEIENLKRKEVVEEFRLKLKNRFQGLEDMGDTLEDNWNTFKTVVQETTK